MCLIRNLKSVLLLTFGLLVLSACGLSSDQELHLSRDLLEYIYARNNGDAIKQIGYTHPTIVKHYVEGDSLRLVKRFQEMPQKIAGAQHKIADSSFIWDNYYVMSVKSTGRKISVHIAIKASNERGEKKSIPHVGMSLNEGQNWVFLREDEMDKLKDK